jgi:hypothetical protein
MSDLSSLARGLPSTLRVLVVSSHFHFDAIATFSHGHPVQPPQSLKNSRTWFQLGIRFASLKPMANIFWRVAVALGIIAIGGTIWGLATGVLVLGDRFF